MANRAHTDADFNAELRQIQYKLSIYFDNDNPLVVTQDNYLIDIDTLDEVTADSTSPLGDISSNTIEFVLHNDNGMFSQANALGPYFGKIRTGVRVVAELRCVDAVDTLDWIRIGTYYVDEWQTEVTGTTARVSASDAMQLVFSKSPIDIPVVRNETYKSFLDRIFVALGITADIDSRLNETLTCTYVKGKPGEFLQDIMAGALALCVANPLGIIKVSPLVATRALRATLTDNDQLIKINAKQSTTRTFKGSSVTYSLAQQRNDVELLRLKGLTVLSGLKTLDRTLFAAGPAIAISNVSILANKNIKIKSYTGTPWDITITTLSAYPMTDAEISVYGSCIDFVDVRIGTDSADILQFKSKYIQNASYASKCKTVLDRLVSSEVPEVTIVVRGNPLLQVGDKIRVLSAKYSFDYTGVIKRIKNKYDGALSCEITLLNASIIEEVL